VRTFRTPVNPERPMPHSPAPNPQPDPDRLEAAADEAIASCGGNIRDALKSVIVANGFLEAEVRQLQGAVSSGYARGRFEPVPHDRKDWYD
jgi:hypothetical protein